MKIKSAFTVLILLGFAALGCKPIVAEFAFFPDNEDVIPTNQLPQGIQEITISTADKVKITSLYLPSNKSDKLLIYFHGNAGNIYYRIPSLLQLQNAGINVIGVSYRGYGKSNGDPTEEGVYQDGKAIFQYAVEQMGFSKENIIIFGRSIGTAVAINTAQNEKIRGVVLVTPMTNGEDQAKAAGLGPISSLAQNSFDNISRIRNIESPLLVIHGTNDQIVPYSMGEEIFNRANVKKKFVRIKGANHNNLHDAYEKEYWPPIIEFIKNN